MIYHSVERTSIIILNVLSVFSKDDAMYEVIERLRTIVEEENVLVGDDINGRICM